MRITRKRLVEIISQEILLHEATTIDKDVSEGIFQAILASQFWEMAHRESDVDLVEPRLLKL